MILYASQPYTRTHERSWQRRILRPVIYTVAIWLRGTRRTYALRTTLSCEVISRAYKNISHEIERKIIWKKKLEKQIKTVLCINNATNEAGAVATSIAESKQKEQQCIGRRIVEVSELAKNFTACSVVISFKSRHVAGCFPSGAGGLSLLGGATRPWIL